MKAMRGPCNNRKAITVPALLQEVMHEKLKYKMQIQNVNWMTSYRCLRLITYESSQGGAEGKAKPRSKAQRAKANPGAKQREEEGRKEEERRKGTHTQVTK